MPSWAGVPLIVTISPVTVHETPAGADPDDHITDTPVAPPPNWYWISDISLPLHASTVSFVSGVSVCAGLMWISIVSYAYGHVVMDVSSSAMI